VEAILRVELPPRGVDANVSPDKTQVRFRRPGQVLAAVNDAFRSALSDESALVRFALRGTVSPGERGDGSDTSADLADRLALLRRRDSGGASPHLDSLIPGVHLRSSPGPELEAEPVWLRHGIPPRPPALLQIAGTFLACPVEGGLLVVDQHSAHERVHYERLRERFDRLGHNPDVQSLIFPEPLSLDADRATLFAEMEPLLRRVGFETTRVGNTHFLVQAVPAALGDRSALRALFGLMDSYADARESGFRSLEIADRLTPIEDRMLMTLACHAAVKAGQSLSEGEMNALWRELVQVELAGHDVHGRPAILLLPTAEIARRMGRG
jgi:DNA mismatch repair protein MutL